MHMYMSVLVAVSAVGVIAANNSAPSITRHPYCPLMSLLVLLGAMGRICLHDKYLDS